MSDLFGDQFIDACEHLSELGNWTYREKLQFRMGVIIGALLVFGCQVLFGIILFIVGFIL